MKLPGSNFDNNNTRDYNDFILESFVPNEFVKQRLEDIARLTHRLNVNREKLEAAGNESFFMLQELERYESLQQRLRSGALNKNDLNENQLSIIAHIEGE